MNAYLFTMGNGPIDGESSVQAVILAESPEQAAGIAGGEFAGAIAEGGGWLVAYPRERFHPPAPEEQSQYSEDEGGIFFWIFRKGPIEILIGRDEMVTYCRLTEVPVLTE